MKQLFLLLFSFFIFHFSFSQSWQWGKRGGGASSTDEQVVDMATDNGGNIYILSRIDGDGFPTVSGSSQTIGGYGGQDISVVSYDCGGNFRWKKTIGGYSGVDWANAIGTDTLGHVYVLGEARQAYYYPPLQPNPIHYDSDYTQPFSNKKSLFLIQYDTSGILKWFRQPSPDAQASSNSNQVRFRGYDIIVHKNGDVEMLCFLSPGLISGSPVFNADSARPYVLKYNALGDVIDLIKPEMNFPVPLGFFESIRMAKTTTGRRIISGSLDPMAVGNPQYKFFMGGIEVMHTMFVGCFDAQWKFIWSKENSTSPAGAGLYYRPIIDSQQNIIMGGSGLVGEQFNGFTITNVGGSSSASLMIIKMDTLGNNIIGKSPKYLNSGCGLGAVGCSNNEIYIVGNYTGNMDWDGVTVYNTLGRLNDIFLVRLNLNTLNTISIDTLKGAANGSDVSTAMIADNNGNVFIGGRMGSNLQIGNDTITSAGGDNDFFIAKYGSANCNTIVPLKLLNFIAKEKDKDVQLQWQTAQEQNTSHFMLQRSADGREFTNIIKTKAAGNSNIMQTYNYIDYSPFTASNSLYYRLQMFDKDGSYTYSKTDLVTLHKQNSLIIYPNPTKQTLNISLFSPTGGVRGSFIITDMAGKTVQQQTIQLQAGDNTTKVNVASLHNGTYFIKAVCSNGCNSSISKFIKE